MVDVETKKKLSFYLEAYIDGQIDLKCNETNGKDWYIARILKDGKLMLHYSIPKDIGLQVNENGRMVLYGVRTID